MSAFVYAAPYARGDALECDPSRFGPDGYFVRLYARAELDEIPPDPS